MKYILTFIASVLLLFYVLVIAPAILSSNSAKSFDMAATFAIILFLFVIIAFLLESRRDSYDSKGDGHDDGGFI